MSVSEWSVGRAAEQRVTEAELAPFLGVTEATMRANHGVKWTKYAADVLPAWVADMDFPVAPCISAAMIDAIERNDLGYPRDDGALAASFGAWATRRWGWTPNPDFVTVMPDVVRSIDHCIEVLTEPGDRIVVTTPIYPPFLKRIAALGRQAIELPLTDDGHRIDWSSVRIAQPAMVLLCSPHNPTGRVLSRAELETVAALGVPIVSDEIHADLVYDGASHLPIACLDDEVAGRTITLTSSSKAFNLAGLRCAPMICGSAELHARLHLDHEPVGALGIAASLAAWTPDGERWLAACMSVLDRNRRRVAEWAAQHGVGHSMPQSTYLAWLDFRACGAPDDAAEWIQRRGAVALSPGLDFGSPGAGHARLNFATSPDLLEQVLSRVTAAISM